MHVLYNITVFFRPQVSNQMRLPFKKAGTQHESDNKTESDAKNQVDCKPLFG
jgi:hypothetical protein